MKKNKPKSNTKFFRFYFLDFILSRKANGFTLLLSILVVSVILSVGLGIFDIMTKELKLSGIGRESQIAFYAADAGIECFFYWEIKHPDLADSAFGAANTINCAGNSVANNFSGNVSNFTIPLSNNSCAKIKVDKTESNKTTVESRGYNTACYSTSSFKVERAIRLVSTKKESGDTYLPPDAPTGVVAAINPDPTNSIGLSWTSGAGEFYLYKSNDGTNYSQIGGTLSASSYTDTGPFSGSVVYYEVVAHNSYGDSETASKSVSTAGILKTSIDTGPNIGSCWAERDAYPSYAVFQSGSHFGAKNTLEFTRENIIESKISFSYNIQTNGYPVIKISKDGVIWTDITSLFSISGDSGTTDSVNIANVSLDEGGIIKGQSKLYLYYETNTSRSIYCHMDLTPTVVTKFK